MKNKKKTVIAIGILFLVVAGYFLFLYIRNNSIDEIFMDMGEIDDINGSIIAIEITTSGDNNMPDGWHRMLRVNTNEKTNFIKYSETLISLEDLKIGDSVAAYRDNKAIVKKGELFNATKIILLDHQDIRIN